jgi:isochorismate synthase EntC
LQHQEEVRELKESLANVLLAWEKDKEENKKQMDDMRKELRQLLQQVPISNMFKLLFQPIIAIISLTISCTGYVWNHDHHT